MKMMAKHDISSPEDSLKYYPDLENSLDTAWEENDECGLFY